MELAKFDYIFLLLALYLIFWMYGYSVSFTKPNGKYSNYWLPTSLLPIVCYGLIEGLRYGRGVDYFTYKEIYETSENTMGITGQPVFDILNYLMNFFGIHYAGAFVVYCTITIICILSFLKDHRKVALYALPLFLAATLPISEIFVRQFLSLAFVFVAIKHIHKEDWMKFGLYSVVALLIHSASLVIIAIVVILKFTKKPINVYVGIGVYLFFALLFDMSNIGLLKPYIAALNVGDSVRFQGYVENSDSWFSQDAINSIYQQSLPAKVANTLFDISIIWMGSELLKNLKTKSDPLIMFYNIFMLGAWLFQAFFMIEIMRRFGVVMYLFWFIIVAYIFYNIRWNKGTSILNKTCLSIMLLYILALALRFVFIAEDQLFIWDI